MDNHEQISLFDLIYDEFKITKPLRLITLFSGYDSQALALKYLGVKFEHYKTCEWAIKSIQALKDLHFAEDTTDYSKDLTQEQVYDYLFKKGISQNYNEPMSLEQIKRMGEDKARTIYNNIKATHNMVNIQQVHAKDLELDNEHETILTYSFPCQDLSLAGKQKGMSRDSGTRSGMLWEVERILDECKGVLPTVLLMENVPQVIGSNSIKDFQAWEMKLEKLGYVNFVETLNSKHYGVPQQRERTFMVSILGQWVYKFPRPFKLEKRLKDILEKQVDEKYYLSDKQIIDVQNWNAYEKPLKNIEKEKIVSPTLTTRTGAYAAGMILVSEPKEPEDTLKRELCNQLIKEGKVEEGDVVKHSFTGQIMAGKKKCVEKSDGVMITLTTRGDCVGVCVKDETFVGQKYKEFKEENGYMPEMFNPYNKAEIKDVAPTQATQCGSTTSSCSVLIKEELNNNCNIEEPKQYKNLRIRKLTPKECFRLMGVKDEDYEKIAKNQSNASLYHLAGDSIVVDVLMNIFKQLF